MCHMCCWSIVTGDVIKSPQSEVTLCFQFVSAAASSSAAATMTFASRVEPFDLHLRYLRPRMYRSWTMYWITLLWPWPKVTAVALINKNVYVCRIKWEPLNQLLRYWVAISLLPCLSSDKMLEEFCWKLLFCQIFVKKNRMCFFKVKHSIGHISGMVGPIDVKRRGSASVGYWVNYVTSTFDLAHDLDLWFFKVNFQNSCISGIVNWLLWKKKKGFKVQIWALFEEWEGWLTWNERDMSR